MRTRRWVTILALSMAVLAGEKAVASVGRSVDASRLTPTNAVAVADEEREIPTWIDAGPVAQNAFTNIVLGNGRIEGGFTDEAAVLQALAAVPPEPGPSQTRVPEPATLIFVGTGLIGLARFARRKKPEWKSRRVGMRFKATAAQEV